MYIQAVTLHKDTQSRFNNHTVHNMCRILVMATSVMKMGNIVPRLGIESTSLAFQASVLTNTPPRFPDVTTVHDCRVIASRNLGGVIVSSPSSPSIRLGAMTWILDTLCVVSLMYLLCIHACVYGTVSIQCLTYVWLLFYTIPTCFQLYHGPDSMHEMRRRKPKPTLLPTQGIFNLPHHIGMV